LKINFNLLPKYSAVIRTVLEADPKKKIRKSRPEILREFGEEKWKQLLLKTESKPDITTSQLEAITAGGSEVFYEKGDFFYIPQSLIRRKILHYEALYLEMFSKGCSSKVVEVGAGYGSKIIHLSKLAPFNGFEVFAGELTGTGIELIKVLGRNEGVPIKVFECDLVSGYIRGRIRALNGLAFTSYAAHYQDPISLDFFKLFRALGVKRVVHFEPTYELHNTDTVYGLLCRRYIENNGYNRNLLQVLRAGESANICRISHVEPNLFGHAHLPVSVIAWDFV
jgi:hypothetical protein